MIGREGGPPTAEGASPRRSLLLAPSCIVLVVFTVGISGLLALGTLLSCGQSDSEPPRTVDPLVCHDARLLYLWMLPPIVQAGGSLAWVRSYRRLGALSVLVVLLVASILILLETGVRASAGVDG